MTYCPKWDEGWFHEGKTVISFETVDDNVTHTHTVTMFINGTILGVVAEIDDEDDYVDVKETWCYDYNCIGYDTDEYEYYDEYVDGVSRDGKVCFDGYGDPDDYC